MVHFHVRCDLAICARFSPPEASASVYFFSSPDHDPKDYKKIVLYINEIFEIKRVFTESPAPKIELFGLERKGLVKKSWSHPQARQLTERAAALLVNVQKGDKEAHAIFVELFNRSGEQCPAYSPTGDYPTETVTQMEKIKDAYYKETVDRLFQVRQQELLDSIAKMAQGDLLMAGRDHLLDKEGELLPELKERLAAQRLSAVIFSPVSPSQGPR